METWRCGKCGRILCEYREDNMKQKIKCQCNAWNCIEVIVIVKEVVVVKSATEVLP